MRFLFIGDGAYVGDGGRELQRLWTAGVWKPLRNCDGRYVSRQADWQRMSLEALCEQQHVQTSSAVVRCRNSSAGGDGVAMVRLHGGGGLLTYLKEDGRCVHTLNTESGLCRKMIALGLGYKLQLSNPRDEHIFWALYQLLERIDEPERTRSAPPLAAAFLAVVCNATTVLSNDVSDYVAGDCTDVKLGSGGSHGRATSSVADGDRSTHNQPSRRDTAAEMPLGRIRLSLVGAHGVMATKCKKCVVDTVVVVAPTHSAIAQAALRKLRLKTRDEGRVVLALKRSIGGVAAGTVLPRAAINLREFGLQDDAVIAVSVAEEAPPGHGEASSAREVGHRRSRTAEHASAPCTDGHAASSVATAATSSRGEPSRASEVLCNVDVLLAISASLGGLRRFLPLTSVCCAWHAAIWSGDWIAGDAGEWRDACLGLSPLLAGVRHAEGAVTSARWRDIYRAQLEGARAAWRHEDAYALVVLMYNRGATPPEYARLCAITTLSNRALTRLREGQPIYAPAACNSFFPSFTQRTDVRMMLRLFVLRRGDGAVRPLGGEVPSSTREAGAPLDEGDALWSTRAHIVDAPVAGSRRTLHFVSRSVSERPLVSVRLGEIAQATTVAVHSLPHVNSYYDLDEAPREGHAAWSPLQRFVAEASLVEAVGRAARQRGTICLNDLWGLKDGTSRGETTGSAKAVEVTEREPNPLRSLLAAALVLASAAHEI